jgi:hypothetical protein
MGKQKVSTNDKVIDIVPNSDSIAESDTEWYAASVWGSCIWLKTYY